MSRASTMILALLVMNLLLGALSLVVSRGERRSDALRLWGWGLLAYSVGLLITLASSLPYGLHKIVGNSLIAWAPVLTVEGVLAHTPVRLDRRWTVAAWLVSIAPIVANHLGGFNQVLVDLLAPAPIANVLYVIAAVALLRHPPEAARSAARFLALLLVVCVLVWSVRLALIWTSIGVSNDRDRADLTIALFAIAQMVISVAATLGLVWVEVRKMESALVHLAETDGLTGLPNRRATLARFAAERARAVRRERPLAIAIFDIDHFKRVNDHYGHQVGDRMIQHVARLLDRARRQGDIVGRIGGEEFVCVLGEEGVEGALVAANRLRETVSATELDAGETRLTVTLSGGVAVFPLDGGDWDSLYAAADRRLYDAKHGGRNRIVGPAEDWTAGRSSEPADGPPREIGGSAASAG